MAKFYVIKELTNTQGQDGSKIEAVYENEDIEKAKNSAIVKYHDLLAMLHNADDVLFAVVQIHDEYGNLLGGTYKETVDHRVQPEPEPEPNED